MPRKAYSFRREFLKTARRINRIKDSLGKVDSDEEALKVAEDAINAVGGILVGCWLELHRIADALEKHPVNAQLVIAPQLTEEDIAQALDRKVAAHS